MARKYEIGEPIILLRADIDKMFALSREAAYPSPGFIQQIMEYENAHGTIDDVYSDTGFVRVHFPVNPMTGYRGWNFHMHADWLGN